MEHWERNPPTRFFWADIFENSNDGFLTPQWPQYSKRSRTTPLFYTLLSIYTLFWVSYYICSLGGRNLCFILHWIKRFLIAFLRSISSFQYFAWPARCLCDRKWAKKEKYSEFRHLPRDAGTRHLDGWRVASLAKCWRGDGRWVPVAQSLTASRNGGSFCPVYLWNWGRISESQLRTLWRGWSMSSGVFLLDPDDPRHQEFVKRF